MIASRSFPVTEEIRNVPVYFYSSAQSFSGQSSSSGDLLPKMMESESPPPTSSPNKADDSEVSSRRVFLDQQAVQGMKEAVPEGGPPIVRDSGANNEGPGLSGFQPTMILETGERVPSKDGRAPTAASGDPTAPNMLRDMLQKASVSEEHRTLMGTVVERILSAKSGLNEAFMRLLRGFEVCNVRLCFIRKNAPVYR